MVMYAILLLLLVHTVTTAESIEIHRPDPSTWTRTKCGAVGSPAVPAGSYLQNTDYPGNDMDPCGVQGCVLDADSTKDVCAKKCENTKNCVGYIFSQQECSTAALPLCWLKSKMDGKGVSATCRNSQRVAIPEISQPDIPSEWAKLVNASATPLPEYPRPQMVRGGENASFRRLGNAETWINLNGLWEWEKASDVTHTPPFNRTLNSSILVPFPVESCLSGQAPKSSSDVVKEMWYRLTFDKVQAANQRVVLRFGAVDWKTQVFVNTVSVVNNTGGYNGFHADITDVLKDNENEILIYVFDPSDDGAQPNGKQRISAIDNPGGDTYSPNSGIWQTVWLEYVTSLSLSLYFFSTNIPYIRLNSFVRSFETGTFRKLDILQRFAEPIKTP